VVFELPAIAFSRYRFTGGRLANTIVQVIIGGAIVFAVGFWLGRIGAGLRLRATDRAKDGRVPEQPSDGHVAHLAFSPIGGACAAVS
jgi:hypothetical protein